MDKSMDELLIDIETSTGKSSSGIDSTIKKLDKLDSVLINATRNIKKYVDATKNASNLKLDTLSTKNGKNGGSKEDKSQNKALQVLNKAVSQLGKGLNTVNKIIGNTVKTGSKALNNLSKTASKVFPRITNFGKKTTNTLYTAFKKLNRMFSMTALALLGVRGMFTAIRKAVSEYMSYDQVLNNQLRNDWAVLGSLLAPVLERVIKLFSKLVSYVALFIKALTGIDLVARANKKGLDSQTASVKKAVNELGNLASFDDLNVVNFDSGSGSGGSDFTPLTLEDIDTSPIDKFIAKLEANDWYGIGMEIARKISEGLSQINFDVVTEKAKQWGKNMGDLFNGLTDGFSTEGGIKAISDFLSGIVNTFTGFFATLNDTAHFEDFGRLLGNGLSEAINKINAEDLGKALTLKWKAVIDTLYGFVTTFNWSEFGAKVGQSIASGFKNINWHNLARTIHDGLIGIMESGIQALDQINWKDAGKTFFKFIDDIDISDIAKKLKDLIKKVLGSLGDFTSGFGEEDKGKILLFAGALGVLAIAVGKLSDIFKKGKDTKGDIEGVADGLTTFQRIGDGVKNVLTGIGDGIASLGKTFESLGKATEIIAILGGLALVLNSLNELFITFKESGMGIGEIGGILAETLGSITVAFITLAGATKLLDWEGIVGAGVILAGLTTTLLALSKVIDTVAKSGMNMSDVTTLLIGLTTTMISLITALTTASIILSSNPLALVGLLALTGAISVILITLANTLPKILDSVGKFIVTIAPSVIALLTTIGDIIEKIIYALGVAMPPIVDSIGRLCTSIFNGIARVIRTVGDIIVDIMNTAKNLITGVLDKILWFVDNIGEAIENSVDHIISAVTKLINFIVSGIEYLLNTVIVNPINKLINTINNNAIAQKLGWQIGKLKEVEIKRFAPKLATGTNRIEQEGVYHLHKDEAVVPKKYNPAVNNQVYENTNDRLIERIDKFMHIVESMETTNVFEVNGTQLHRETKRYMDRQAEIYGTS